jgi:hypothetical protein
LEIIRKNSFRTLFCTFYTVLKKDINGINHGQIHFEGNTAFNIKLHFMYTRLAIKIYESRILCICFKEKCNGQWVADDAFKKIVFQSDNINEMYSNFTNILDNHIDLHVPQKTVTIRPKDKPFMNNTIRRCMRQRNRMHYKAKHTKNPQHWQNYRDL